MSSPSADLEQKLGFSSRPQGEIQEVSANITEISDGARSSLDFLAALAIPTVFRYLFPPIFQAIWQFLLSYISLPRDFSQLAIGLPRGFGKTMVVKLFVLYCILFTRKQFILIICSTQTKANNIIADIMGMLNERNIQRVFGDWRLGIITDRLDLKRFGYRGRNIILMGAGSGSDIRGITLENERPDLMIFDDVQSKEDSESQTVSEALETWLYGTAMKAKSPHGCTFIFIANMYPSKYSLLRRIKHNPTWIKFIAGGILSNGESLWEELQPLEQLLREYERDLHAGHPEIFHSEVLNDENASVNRAIDISSIPQNYFESEDSGLHQGNFIIIDPSNDKANSDLVAIIYVELFDGIPVVQECIEERLSPGDIVDTAIRIALLRNCRLIAIESNAFQYSLLYWFNRICNERGIIGIHPVDVYSGMLSKNSRILTMFKQLLPSATNPTGAPEIYLSSRVRSQILSRITQFNPLKSNNIDNILDVLTYIPRVLECYGEFIGSSLTLEFQEFHSIPVLTETANSPF